MAEQRPQKRVADLDTLKLLKLMTQPVRYRIGQVLRHGPVTSTTLARALGLNTGATSYHLRQLAEYGFIEEVPEEELTSRSHGRERWWRSRRMDLRIPRRSEQDPQMRAVANELFREWMVADFEEFAGQLERDDLGEWGDELPYSRGSIRVTRDELRQFAEEYIDLLYRYDHSDEDAPPGARVVHTRFFAFPAIDPLPYSEEDIEPTTD